MGPQVPTCPLSWGNTTPWSGHLAQTHQEPQGSCSHLEEEVSPVSKTRKTRAEGSDWSSPSSVGPVPAQVAVALKCQGRRVLDGTPSFMGSFEPLPPGQLVEAEGHHQDCTWVAHSSLS